MTDIRIRRLRKRYRLALRSRAATSRLDQVVRDAIDAELLEAALERAGIRRTDEICIRRASANARLSEADSPSRMATAWSLSIADAIVKALRDGGSNVVIYGSPHQALSDMVVSALRGDLSRSWAWKELGLWSADDIAKAEVAASEVVNALIHNPIAAPAVVRDAARSGVLPRLLDSVSPAQWERLAHQVLIAYRAASARADYEQESVEVSPDEIDIDSIVARSQIIRSLQDVIDDTATAEAVAMVALAEADGAVLLRSSAVVARVVSRLAARLKRASKKNGGDRSAPIESPKPASGSAARTSRDEEQTASPTPARDSVRTNWGGLLFLLNLLREHDFKAFVLELPGRPLAWTLYQLALLLAPGASGDAALLAFAGLAPSQELPTNDRAPTEEERNALEKIRSSVAMKLRAVLNAGEDELDAEVVARVASRGAEIITDPAWIEVHLKLSEVTTEVRRAGLDLDPGWIPWLGVVVRFIYD